MLVGESLENLGPVSTMEHHHIAPSTKTSHYIPFWLRDHADDRAIKVCMNNIDTLRF